MRLFPGFSADPGLIRSCMDTYLRESGVMQQFFQLPWSRIEQTIFADISQILIAEVSSAVDVSDNKELTIPVEDTADLLQILSRIGPEIKAFHSNDPVE